MIPTDKIRDLIGPGGKVIRGIIDATGVKIDVDDTGRVNVASSDADGLAKRHPDDLRHHRRSRDQAKPTLAKSYGIAEFGAFVEIFPGTDGLLHVSEIAEHRVKEVKDELREGDQILVKVHLASKATVSSSPAKPFSANSAPEARPAVGSRAIRRRRTQQLLRAASRERGDRDRNPRGDRDRDRGPRPDRSEARTEPRRSSSPSRRRPSCSIATASTTKTTTLTETTREPKRLPSPHRQTAALRRQVVLLPDSVAAAAVADVVPAHPHPRAEATNLVPK